MHGLINTSRLTQHKHECAITKIKNPTARRRRGPLGVQVSAINYFTHVVGPPLGKTLSVLQDLTPVVVDHLQLHFYPIVA